MELQSRSKLALPEELKDYDSYEVVYVKDGKITERLACTVEDGYVVSIPAILVSTALWRRKTSR